MYTPTPRVRTALVIVAAVGLALAAARAASAGGTCHQSPSESSTTTVELSALCFSPTIARVDVGSSVEFVNLDGFAHNVVGHGVSWGQFADMAPGDSVVARFDTPGIHPFSCTLHPGMVGAIVVGEVATSNSTQAESHWSTVGAVSAAVLVGTGAMLWPMRRRSQRHEERR